MEAVQFATKQPLLAIVILAFMVVISALGIVYFIVQKKNGNGNGHNVSFKIISDKIDRVDRATDNMREKITQLEMDSRVSFMECEGILKNINRSIDLMTRSIEKLVNVFDGSK